MSYVILGCIVIVIGFWGLVLVCSFGVVLACLLHDLSKWAARHIAIGLMAASNALLTASIACFSWHARGKRLAEVQAHHPMRPPPWVPALDSRVRPEHSAGCSAPATSQSAPNPVPSAQHKPREHVRTLTMRQAEKLAQKLAAKKPN